MESIITFDEYNYLKELSRFDCPWGRDHGSCWLDMECPKRPDPCVECPSTREVDWARETCDKKIIEKTWSKHEKNCDNCTLWIDHEEEPTYREVCERMKHARLILRLVREGNIEIFNSNNHSGLRFQ